jgi:hypothetical protein
MLLDIEYLSSLNWFRSLLLERLSNQVKCVYVQPFIGASGALQISMKKEDQIYAASALP